MGYDFVEKYCSRCDQASWDNMSGSYRNICTVDGKKCDNNGRTFINGKEK